MSATVVDGKAIAAAVMENIREQIEALSAPLHLVAVCVGDDAGLKTFVKLKQKAAHAAGMECSSYFFGANDEADATDTLKFLAADESVQGIFIELPLPESWDRDALTALIPTDKDVDALTKHPKVPAPSVKALEYVLTEYGIELRGLRAAVVGQGRLVGAPIAQWLTEQGARVDEIDIHTTNPAAVASQAQLVVAGTGVAGLITVDWVAEGATVIDFGYSKDGGDVNFKSVQKKAGVLTPVPGGMGPLVIAAVLENLLTLATTSRS